MLSWRFTIKFILMSVIIMAGAVYMHIYQASHVDPYPARPIKIIVPFSAGGTVDLVARVMGRPAMKYFGQPLVVRNIPGGGATIGWNELAGSNPDGYTIGIVSNNVMLQPLYAKTRYHYGTALEPVAQIGAIPIVAVVLADQPWQNIGDLVAYAKKHPSEIKYGHQGLGVPSHVVGEMLKKETEINITQVPFDGGAETLAALLGGHIQLIFITTSVVKDHIRSGRIKVLGVAADRRISDPIFKDVPTFKEQGINVAFDHWCGIGVPKQLPKDIKNKLAEGLKAMINDPEFKQSMEMLGLDVEYLGPQQCIQKWIEEDRRLRKIVEDNGIADIVANQKN